MATGAARTERLLAEVLAAVLRVERVSADSHFFDDLGADSLVMAQFCARVRKRDDLPTVSMKDIYRYPTIQGVATAVPVSVPSLDEAGAAGAGTAIGVSQALDVRLAEVLAAVLRVERVSVDSHFFDDLGADSLVMAQFCARARKRDDLPTVSMRDIYRYPTIETLAAAFAVGEPSPVRGQAPSGIPLPSEAQAVDVPSGDSDEPPLGTLPYVLCGAAQLLFFLVFSSVGGLVAIEGYEWVIEGSRTVDLYRRAVSFSAAVFFGLCALPIVAKWLLVGRFTHRRLRVWSVAYLRFWCVKAFIRTSPARLLAGSPLYGLYLRALGARIGKGVVILSRTVPVCTDLLSIGDGTLIRKDVHLSCYRAHDGWIETGSVTLGAQVIVSEQTVLDIDTSMGDGAQLGHASSLQRGQSVPAGESWHGSPAEATTTDYSSVPPVACGTLRPAIYSLGQLAAMLLVYLPMSVAGVSIVLSVVPQLNAVLGPESSALTNPASVLAALLASLVVFIGAAPVGLVLVGTLPRLLRLAIKPDRVYPLYGFHYGVQRAILRLTNIRFFTTLFGDSSAIVHYLRCLGYDLRNVQQTGSNFGTMVKHDTPYLSKVGSGTMVADGLSIINAEFSSTSFRLSRTSIGPDNFLGNNIAYPSGGRTGDNCLLATKVLVPIDGPVREGVGLLGSPSFEIPRTVMRDTQFDGMAIGDELRRRLAAKNRHNALTASLHLLVRWFHFVVLALIGVAAVDLYDVYGVLVLALASLVSVAFTVMLFTLIERAVTGFRPLKPLYCSIYDPAFWSHERFWKLTSHRYMEAFNGTPFKALVWRLLGAKVGRRVFDDGCTLIERTLVSIGDDCTLNAASVVQSHSQEDGAFKSDHATLGRGVTLGVGAFVHYGTVLGDQAQLDADTFLMKGEEVPPRARWGGNPAVETGRTHE
ncbi:MULTISPECIES: Pls/PosA family non-ribosomal peptide synthetase [unclassified Streptomyces]|uniref:Pls/PosA family non-ribosomal peptide synthetase n=1 Tax=unclassified Streptomyces TaxID=2593676 RepID=UPI002E814D25|nr:Pls/PosA family non-ribosomal peptide synthetase [Streptomyces sp. NBC_00589]WTI42502.1 phosphopantetheine-binding protein [Streptomyces sp. NBC_00775]WUB33277.1 phosphopantetheine-binding protein [Streptomyces sp. NBC_00589]